MGLIHGPAYRHGAVSHNRREWTNGQLDNEKHICVKKKRRERTSLFFSIEEIFCLSIVHMWYMYLILLMKALDKRVDSRWTEDRGTFS
jgi:hypothetical protein